MNRPYARRTDRFDRFLLAGLAIATLLGGATSLYHWATFAIDVECAAQVASMHPASEESVRPSPPVLACPQTTQVASAD